MTGSRSAVEIVRAYLDALGGDDADAIAGFVADDFDNRHLSALGDDSSGLSEYRSRLPGFLADFPRRRYVVDEIIDHDSGDDEVVVVRYRLYAEHHCVDISVPGIVWFRVRGGKIVQRIDSWDGLTVMRQLEADESA